MMQQEAGGDKRGGAPMPSGVEKVLTLFRHVGALGVRVDLENSFKVIHGRCAGDRLLLGVPRSGPLGAPDSEIASTCERIGMPQNLLASFLKDLPAANHVYFGADQSDSTLVFKTYLEFRTRIEAEFGGSAMAGSARTLFTGFKWDTTSPARQAVTRYDWHPALAVPEMLERMRTVVDPDRYCTLLDVVRRILERAARQVPCADLQYLEVTEEGNPRRSFDVNLYRAHVAIGDVQPLLVEAARHYAISLDGFDAMLGRIRSEPLGHVAGGVDRESRDFMTVYYGARHVDGGRLRSARLGQAAGH